jgi:hypothetical protein
MTYKIVNELLTYCNSMHYTYGLSTDKFVTYTIYYARYLFRLDSYIIIFAAYFNEQMLIMNTHNMDYYD